MNWLTTSLKTFDDRYPGVKTEYLSTNEYSLQNFITILNQAIATHPDGIAVPILNSEALQPILDKAIQDGIPVVAFGAVLAGSIDRRLLRSQTEAHGKGRIYSRQGQPHRLRWSIWPITDGKNRRR